MRVIYNQLAALGPKAGIGHYTAELLAALQTVGQADRVHGFPQGWFRTARQIGVRLRPFLDAKHSHRPGVRTAMLNGLRKLGERQLNRQFRKACGSQTYSLYHEPNYNPLETDLPTVATLHDLSVLLHPEWHPDDRVRHFEKHFPNTVARCAHFIAVSESTRHEVIRVLGVSPRSVTRVYNGIRAHLRPLPTRRVTETLQKLDLPRDYLLFVGTIEPRKNSLRLLQAYCALEQDVRERWPLLMVGGWGWNSAPVANYLHDVARHKGVIQVGYLAEEHLACLYGGARALLYPSLYEGFGLPPLEMMACGGAVIASTATAIVEVAGTGACLVDAEDTDGWRCAMQRVVTDDDWWQGLRARAPVVARPYTWERCARETLNVYRTVAQPAILPFTSDAPARRAA